MPRLIMLGGERRLVRLRPFRDEKELQDLLEATPEAIPLEDADPEAAPLTPIGREVGVESGAMDLLYADALGVLTVVETKLISNPQARREVVAQVLDYASQMAKWSADDVESVARKYGKRPDLYRWLVGPAVEPVGEQEQLSPEDLRAALEENLRAGRIRMIVAVDGQNQALRDLVTFVNSNSNFDIFLLEVSAYADTAEQAPEFLVPSLYGYAQKRPPPEKRFWEKVRQNRVPLEPVGQLLEFAKQEAGHVWWGRGAVFPSFTFHAFTPGRRRVSLFTVYSDGTVTLNFGWMMTQVPEGVYRRYKEALHAVPGLEFADNVKWPSLPIGLLEKPEAMARFKEAVLQAKGQISSLSVDQAL